LERLARGPGCRRYPGRRGCREAQALNELPPVHFSLFEILEQFCDDTFHCLFSYSEFRRDSIGLPALCHYTICEGSVGRDVVLCLVRVIRAPRRTSQTTGMSASPPKADIERRDWHVRFVPIATERSAAKNYSSARPNSRDFAERDLWNIDSGSASVHLDVEGADHLAPLLDFVSDELCEVAGRARQRLAEVSQTDLHLGVGEGRVDLLV